MMDQGQVPFERALVALIPQAEALVGPFRQRYDPSAAAGMPAHITINYPFTPASVDDPVFGEELKSLFAGFQAFDFHLSRIERFPDVLYLAPAPVQPFLDLIHHAAERFPESPPYGGAFDPVIPHLTVAQVADPTELNPVAESFQRAADSELPIQARVERVWLMDDCDGRWMKRAPLPLSA
jgi:2'-5' RNA ligase